VLSFPDIFDVSAQRTNCGFDSALSNFQVLRIRAMYHLVVSTPIDTHVGRIQQIGTSLKDFANGSKDIKRIFSWVYRVVLMIGTR